MHITNASLKGTRIYVYDRKQLTAYLRKMFQFLFWRFAVPVCLLLHRKPDLFAIQRAIESPKVVEITKSHFKLPHAHQNYSFATIFWKRKWKHTSISCYYLQQRQKNNAFERTY